jgi:hypothetical protein
MGRRLDKVSVAALVSPTPSGGLKGGRFEVRHLCLRQSGFVAVLQRVCEHLRSGNGFHLFGRRHGQRPGDPQARTVSLPAYRP